MTSILKKEWTKAMDEELQALKENDVWTMVVPPTGSHVLDTKWVFKTTTDAAGKIERFRARLVACENEQVFVRLWLGIRCSNGIEYPKGNTGTCS